MSEYGSTDSHITIESISESSNESGQFAIPSTPDYKISGLSRRKVFNKLILNKTSDRHSENHEKNIQKALRYDKEAKHHDKEYVEQIAELKDNQPAVIQFGSVGEFLHGCFQPYNNVEVSCTPSCINGFPNHDLHSCEVPVYIKSNNKINKIHNNINSTAYVFVLTGQILDGSDLQFIKKDKIKNIIIYNQDGDNINFNIGETIELDSTADATVDDTTTSGWTWVWIVLFVIVVIALIILLFSFGSAY